MTTHSRIPSRSTPIVLKLGGSLINHVPDLVPVLSSSPRPLLIVPGGGPFANAVRQAGLDDETAHWEAIAAMEQYGRAIARHGLPVTDRLAVPGRTVILLPLCLLREYDPLPHTWDVTSDTIAAWVAAKLRLDLILLKSVDGIVTDGIVQDLVHTPQETDVVDPLFLSYVLENHVDTFILNASCPDRLARFLQGEPVPGTRISTTF